ncbi:Vacuolar t-SNARE [Komagataella phaffii CBS 7435]|uniref:Target membrane receptor (t-SNARE) n=2 Tax=Komagataella phaffii TaxID=460519 RepID=C4R231_KOMPG|nr:Target membrane receptor (t-SNARE) [Komagataella phaffii GS115]AOA62833.1 GQ67_00976T0 [Komagataella phaffii]CAH2447898.1 Vacuolar t-SNARE [Komagataella phaffii CBS 7435]AOA67602.1 GQ68_00413T0 [Komagataella phaffii GS115]CAY69555.1 Target membrane receptor (t-SNARE) [Komagataella phaffii GS115]CCA38064.1 Vacuolar t-SNARE [Komagataella phaffii CBS 7435]
MSFANFDAGAQKNKVRIKEADTERANSDSDLLRQTSLILSSFVEDVSMFGKLQQQLGTKRDNERLRGQIESSISKCDLQETRLRQVTSELESNSYQNDSPNVKYKENKLLNEASRILKNYQSLKIAYDEKISSIKVREAFEQNTRQANEAALEQEQHNLETETTPLISNQIQKIDDKHQSALNQAEVSYHSVLINQRSEAIQDIHTGVGEINAIFKDLGTLVQQQGQNIDTIEVNMMSHANNNQEATHELIKADNYQKKKRKWSCALLLALVIVLVLVLAIIS